MVTQYFEIDIANYCVQLAVGLYFATLYSRNVSIVTLSALSLNLQLNNKQELNTNGTQTEKNHYMIIKQLSISIKKLVGSVNR